MHCIHNVLYGTICETKFVFIGQTDQGNKALISQEDAEKLLNEAMKNGYVTSQSIVVILIGMAGSGKSSFRRVVLNHPPEEKRVSTPLTEPTVRNISMSKVIVEGQPDSVKWEMVTPEELLAMVADAIKISPQPASTDISMSQNNTKPVFKEVVEDLFDANETVQQDRDEELDFDDDPLISLISQSKGSEHLLTVHWVYIIDTGGQPQFLQLLPAFIKNISTCVCFVRLDQSLDDKPPVKLYDTAGEQCGKSYTFEQTNLQVIESCVRTIHSKCGIESKSPPNIFVVGTHHDEMKNSPETLKMKNQKLESLLRKQQTLISYKDNCLIFPMNCKKPEEEDKIVASEFRKCVMKRCHEPMSKTPLAWFVLEQRIRQYSTKKKVACVERKKCLKLALKLHMTPEIFQAALDHLLKLNIFRSYASVPDLIFCDTQVVVLKLNELVHHSFKLRRDEIIGVTREDEDFKSKGIISMEFLDQFFLITDTFTSLRFLCILRELLAVADMGWRKGVKEKKEKRDKLYFLPCLLEELSDKEVSKYRKSHCALLLYLDGGCLPNGLFTSLISSLNNDHEWILHDEPVLMYRNCMTFDVPVGGCPGVITLIASFQFIEVHVKCPEEISGDILDSISTKVFADIKSGLESSLNLLYRDAHMTVKHGFICNCSKSSLLHHATVFGKFWKCSLHSSQGGLLNAAQQHWNKNISTNKMVRQFSVPFVGDTQLYIFLRLRAILCHQVGKQTSQVRKLHRNF